MIEISVVNNETSYKIELFPPLLELADIEFRMNCIRELSLSFDLAVRDILFGKQPSEYQMYFKKGYLGTAEIVSATIGFDSILTISENFKSLEETVEKHIKALDAVLGKVDFSPKIQMISYQAHANVEDAKLNGYLDIIGSNFAVERFIFNRYEIIGNLDDLARGYMKFKGQYEIQIQGK